MTNWTDIVNGGWEFAGGISIILSIIATYRAKEVKGMSTATMLFFLFWGIWNIFFYPMNGHMFSFYGGIFLSTMNLIWVILIFKYKKK